MRFNSSSAEVHYSCIVAGLSTDPSTSPMVSPLPAMRRLTFLLLCTWLTRRSTEGFSQCSSVIALFHPCIITRCRYPAVSGQGLIIRLNLGQQVSPVFLHLHSCLTHSSAAQVPACPVSTSLRVRNSVTVKSPSRFCLVHLCWRLAVLEPGRNGDLWRGGRMEARPLHSPIAGDYVVTILCAQWCTSHHHQHSQRSHSL